MAKHRGGSPPFVEDDGVVFPTEVTDERPNQPGLRGEAEEASLRSSQGIPKGSNVDDEALGRGTRKGK